MPKLLVFAPCEKVIISQDENNPTLIAVIHEVNGVYQLDASASDQTPAILPWRWNIFTMWRQESGDQGKTFKQTIRFVSPSGQSAKPTQVAFKSEQLVQRVVIQVGNIPGSENGVWTLMLFLNEEGEELSAEPFATYPINIQFSKVDTFPPAEVS